MEEIWKPIKGYEDYYLISNMGRVKSIKRRMYTGRYGKTMKDIPSNRILALCDKGNGYYVVTLGNTTKKKNFAVHRLVAEHFIDNPNNYPVVNHKDFNTFNNRVDNLEWCTYQYNAQYSSIHMCKPTLSKTGVTGERYVTIYKTKTGKVRFRVCLKGHKQKVGFLTLQEAVNYRNEILKDDDYYSPIRDLIISGGE